MARFVKGQSGNPNGRPKDQAKIGQLARDHSQEAMNRLVYWMRSDNARASIAACNVLLDRAFGKPHQSMDLTNSDGSFVASIARAAARGLGERFDSEQPGQSLQH